MERGFPGRVLKPKATTHTYYTVPQERGKEQEVAVIADSIFLPPWNLWISEKQNKTTTIKTYCLAGRGGTRL